MKVRSDHRSEFSNLCNWKLEAWKKFRLQRDSNPWPPRYRCDALPTELWSHTLGARSIVGSHFPVRGVKWCKVYEIIHIWTADIDESEKWSSQWIFQFMQLEIGSLNFFQASNFQLHKLENSLRWSLLTFRWNCVSLHKIISLLKNRKRTQGTQEIHFALKLCSSVSATVRKLRMWFHYFKHVIFTK